MAEDLCFFSKDALIIKPPKKSPLLLRMVVLSVAMLCGVYICSICLKQIGSHTNRPVIKIPAIGVENICEPPHIEPSERPYVHFPKPKTFSRAECACNPVRYFAILSTQRSGSGWFETLLNNHTNISSNGEIFSVKVRRSNISTIVDTLDNIYNLDWFTSASKNECTAAVGLKWMLNQNDIGNALRNQHLLSDHLFPYLRLSTALKHFLISLQGLLQNHEEIVEYFKRKGVSTIFLFRRNLLRRMVSILANSYDQNAKPLNGTHKSHVHSPLEAEILARYKPVINTTLLIPSLRQAEELVTKGLESFKSTRHIILYYEDIIQNRTKLIDVQDFLTVPHRELHSRQIKIHKGPLSSQVENWGDIEKTLKGTPFESFLQVDQET
nr:P-loop containing nucleoside triphosphate hydrolase [Ipomoea batatas]